MFRFCGTARSPNIHGKSFMELAHGMYGHTDFRHNIMKGEEERTPAKMKPSISVDQIKKRLKPGSQISFHYEGKVLRGKLSRRNAKTASVTDVVHSDGKKYKHMVPYDMIIL